MISKLIAITTRAVTTLCLVFALSSAAFAIADLSEWTGENNAPPDPEAENNNYVLIGSAPQTAAGGTLQARRDRPSGGATPRNNAWLSDFGLVGGTGTDSAYGFNNDLAITGTVTFANPNNADPNFFFGFYHNGSNNDPSTQNGIDRLGLAFGDSSTDFFRVQSNARDNFSNTNSVNSLTIDGTAGGTAPLHSGTYPFEITWTAATKNFHASIGSGTDLRKRDVSVPGLVSAEVLDHFGIFQFGETIANPTPAIDLLTWTFSVSNITYTGNTPLAISPDYNGNGTVDAADYVRWRKDPDSFGGVPAGYTTWRANFGSPAGAGSSLGPQTVPEPSVIVLLALSSLGLVIIGHRKD